MSEASTVRLTRRPRIDSTRTKSDGELTQAYQGPDEFMPITSDASPVQAQQSTNDSAQTMNTTSTIPPTRLSQTDTTRTMSDASSTQAHLETDDSSRILSDASSTRAHRDSEESPRMLSKTSSVRARKDLPNNSRLGLVFRSPANRLVHMIKLPCGHTSKCVHMKAFTSEWSEQREPGCEICNARYFTWNGVDPMVWLPAKEASSGAVLTEKVLDEISTRVSEAVSAGVELRNSTIEGMVREDEILAGMCHDDVIKRMETEIGNKIESVLIRDSHEMRVEMDKLEKRMKDMIMGYINEMRGWKTASLIRVEKTFTSPIEPSDLWECIRCLAAVMVVLLALAIVYWVATQSLLGAFVFCGLFFFIGKICRRDG